MSGPREPAGHELTAQQQAPIAATGATAGRRVPPSGGRAAVAPLGGGERFAAYVAHELRTPLATQRALLELALGDPETDAAGWREIGEDVLGACRQQERVLEACLALARSRGGGPQRCEPVDLAAIAAEALRAHDLRGLGSVVVLEPAQTAGDPDLLERLAANLVLNAIGHNVAGGRVEVATGTTSGRAHLTVANTGPPIPAGELRRLFQPFQRLAPEAPGADGGVGLGLAIVQTIADTHGALISARARTDGGLEIDVSFLASSRILRCSPCS